jgi:hypothetical protein
MMGHKGRNVHPLPRSSWRTVARDEKVQAGASQTRQCESLAGGDGTEPQEEAGGGGLSRCVLPAGSRHPYDGTGEWVTVAILLSRRKPRLSTLSTASWVHPHSTIGAWRDREIPTQPPLGRYRPGLFRGESLELAGQHLIQQSPHPRSPRPPVNSSVGDLRPSPGVSREGYRGTLPEDHLRPDSPPGSSPVTASQRRRDHRSAPQGPAKLSRVPNPSIPRLLMLAAYVKYPL